MHTAEATTPSVRMSAVLAQTVSNFKMDVMFTLSAKENDINFKINKKKQFLETSSKTELIPLDLFGFHSQLNSFILILLRQN